MKRALQLLNISFWCTVVLVLTVGNANAGPIGTCPDDCLIWDFNLPATATSSHEDPPVYPSLGTLTLQNYDEEAGGGDRSGVKFTFDPTPEVTDSGYTDPSKILFIDHVFDAPDSYALDWSLLSGPAITDITFLTNSNNFDSGYKADDQHIVVDWGNKNSSLFDPTEISMWALWGVNLTNFSATTATSGPKPTPITAVLSVSAYALTGITPTPSNWVSCVEAGCDAPSVPEPGILSLLGLGLLGLGLSRRRLKVKSS